jgi:prepilin-type N-terminal cleavage/methylation domain-containing protein
VRRVEPRVHSHEDRGRRRRCAARGFTLLEVVVALAVGGVLLLGARRMLETVGDGAQGITEAAKAADREANGERLLRALLGRLEVGTDSTRTFSGEEQAARFTSWCDVPAGWQERCIVTLVVGAGPGGATLTASLSTGLTLDGRGGSRAGWIPHRHALLLERCRRRGHLVSPLGHRDHRPNRHRRRARRRHADRAHWGARVKASGRRSPHPRATAVGAPARSGFVLLAVLWVLLGLAMLALTSALAGREAVLAARNRVSLARARWRAEGCLERARAAIGEALIASSVTGVAARGRSLGWSALDEVAGASPLLREAGCDVVLQATGGAVDVNEADGEQLRALFAAMGVPVPASDSLGDALLDWIDEDDVQREHGAERAWYKGDGHGRHPPRNGPIADMRELEWVRGVDQLLRAHPDVRAVLTVEPGRIVLARAPPPVLASLPGFGDEAIGHAAALRLAGEPIEDLLAFGAGLSLVARQALGAHHAELLRRTAREPEAWIVTSRARSGAAPVVATVEARMARSGTRAAVVRRRTWW